ncbi:lipocalin family protein [Mycolicibacterium palauense]|uniref:lipocalin family protein n=1 Tax=Mycolicibacterium palauense TaxID=2034511 RepID=UPI001FE7D784|nr:lipocalin family protein [Mycolicibacterium palauense]
MSTAEGAALSALAPTHAPTTSTQVGAPLESAPADTVTGVKTSHAKLTIPVGTRDLTTRADWYFPTQADGSVAATGVIWLQHGFLGTKFLYTALAETLAQQTNSIVVAANLPSFPALRCGGCWINGPGTQQAVAELFLGDRATLTSSATAAGLQGMLPEDFVLSGHSAGGGFATAVGGYYEDDPTNDGSLRGVVMFDGFSFPGVVPNALQSLDDPYIPVYQIAAPPQLWNLNGAITKELVAARPDTFVGVTLAHGSHVDSLLGGNPLVDFFAQLVTRFSPPGNTAAVHTLATGWINDLYQGLGPADGNGIYGDPDQYIVMGDTAAVVLAPPPVVDVNDYLGTWYEVGSVKQFFSLGLVNTTAVYSLNPDGSIRVENSGNYFFDNGPESSIVGAALPVDPTNNKLNVRFFGPPSDNPPGNYWIVDLDPDYQWAIVSDPTGLSGFLLSRTRTVSEDFYQELLNRASVKGVRGWITRTRQPAAATASSA